MSCYISTEGKCGVRLDCIQLKITELWMSSLEIVKKINCSGWQVVQTDLDCRED